MTRENIEIARLPLTRTSRGVTGLPRHPHLSLADVAWHKDLAPRDGSRVIDQVLESAGAYAGFRAANVPDDSPLVAAARQEGPDAERWNLKPAGETAWFDMDAETVVPGSLRRNISRLRRKLDQEGDVQTVCDWQSDAETRNTAFAEFLELEASGWKGANGTGSAISADKALTGFYQQLLSPETGSFTPVIHRLKFNEKTIAAQYGLITGSTLSLLKVAYDETYAKFSPGSLLLSDVLGAAPEHGLERVSLVTSPAWSKRWHPNTQPIWHVTRYASGVGGQALRRWDTSRARLKHLIRPAGTDA